MKTSPSFLRYVLGALLICSGAPACASAASDRNASALSVLIYQDLLQNHRVKNTGLFLSFPETRDHKLSQQASTYDQGTVGLLALKMGDDETVESLLKFFNEQWDQAAGGTGHGGLANFYNAYFGTTGIEGTAHAGPNAWIGLLAARAARLNGSRTGRDLAIKIAHWIKDDLPHRSGIVAMSNQVDPLGTPWPSVFSTENNISYDAFLSELLKLPLANEDKLTFAREQKDIEHWLIHVAYQPESNTVLRGINPRGPDRTPALDVYTWLFLTLGPQRLHQEGIDPEAFLRKAADLFETRVDDQIGVAATTEGQKTLWYEGTGHYILCLKFLEQFSGNRAGREKIERLTRSFDLGSVIPDRIPPRCPYTTPGKDPSPALISGVWRAFIDMNYNPLRDDSRTRYSRKNPEQIMLWRALGIEGDTDRMVRYGTSQEMMNQVWAYDQKNRGDDALREAYALIEEWSALAHEQQHRKKERWGGLLSYTGNPKQREEILSYAALNDVSAACLMIGKIFHEQGNDYQAKVAFNQIFEHYSLGQVWDAQGWFWSPAQTAFKDYIQVYPQFYGFMTPAMAAEIPDEVPASN